MKTVLIYSSMLCMILAISCTSQPQVKEQPVAKPDASQFMGQWTLDIAGGWVGWLEIKENENTLKGSLLWKWGSVTPLDTIFVAPGDKLVAAWGNNVMYSFGTDGIPAKHHVSSQWIEVVRNGEKIGGKMIEPHQNGKAIDSTAFSGVKLPEVPAAPDLGKVKFGKPVTLFNGKDLTGWKLVDDKLKNGFSVVKGVLFNNPEQKEGQPHIEYGNLRTVQEFEDFNLKVDVNVPEGSNSGIYLRGMYEIQVLDSYKKPLDSHNMGALYSRITPSVNAEKPAGQWQTVDITLCQRHVTVILNGVKIIDNQPVYGPTGGAIKSDVFAPGPIFLQGDHGKVSYRNILLTPIVK
ncbi:MAG TPA: DUF1080 domain-containing protein [Bacteroidales bacterium]|nr:DUF1080 domain-containing protein [Bacteroidales bacterium]